MFRLDVTDRVPCRGEQCHRWWMRMSDVRRNEPGLPRSPMTDGSTTALMRKAYARWAPIYDVVYDKLTEPAARTAVNAAMACGPRVLEAGVGTGLALGYYPGDAEVYGVDLSEDMLRRAQEK